MADVLTNPVVGYSAWALLTTATMFSGSAFANMLWDLGHVVVFDALPAFFDTLLEMLPHMIERVASGNLYNIASMFVGLFITLPLFAYGFVAIVLPMMMVTTSFAAFVKVTTIMYKNGLGLPSSVELLTICVFVTNTLAYFWYALSPLALGTYTLYKLVRQRWFSSPNVEKSKEAWNVPSPEDGAATKVA